MDNLKTKIANLFAGSDINLKEIDKGVTVVILRIASLLFSEKFTKISFNGWGSFTDASLLLYGCSGSWLFDPEVFPWLREPCDAEAADTVLTQVVADLRKSFDFSRENLGQLGSIYEGLLDSGKRRKSGSHYTPVKLAKEVVAEAFRPWLESHNYNPSAKDILELKVCDPAVGGGIFLLETAEFLRGFAGDAHLRKIVESCLYGVDKDSMSVEVTKMALWLFVEDTSFDIDLLAGKIVEGDSLIGVSLKDIENALETTNIGGNLERHLRQYKKQQSEIMPLFHSDSRSDADDDRKRQALEDMESSTAYLRTVGDLLVAAYFNGRSSNERNSKKDIYMAATIDCSTDAELQEVMAEPLEDLRDGEQGIKPLHWELTFPSVFQAGNPGFDAFVGNPPYLGGRLIARSLGDEYTPALKEFLALRKSSADLVVYFVARCSGAACTGGSIALITTKSIKEGDTRPIFQDIIEKNNHDIYYATTSRLWPGAAGTSYVSFAMTKDAGVKIKRLDGVLVDRISSALAAEEADPNPFQLTSKYNASRGATLMGDGFIVSKCEEDELLKNDSRSAEIIKRYVGADDMLNIVQPVFPRGCIDFGDMSESIASEYKAAFNRVYMLVKPVRDRLTKQIHETCFWKHWDKRLDFFTRLREEGAGIIIPRVAKYMLLERHSAVAGNLYSDSVNIVASADWGLYATLQSRIHETWVNKFKSSRDARIIYNVKSCFRTFPCPKSFSLASGGAVDRAIGDSLDNTPSAYHQFRARLMVANNEGLTTIYNRFHDPEETSKGILELRRLHSDMDQAVLNAYGWSDVPIACGYGLDYLDLNENVELPVELAEVVDSGDIFFWEAKDAVEFQKSLKERGAIGKRRLPWRYCWPTAVKEDVLARLLALNAERYAEEVSQGLHS